MPPRNGSAPDDWGNADNTQSRIAVLHERSQRQAEAIAEHDETLGAIWAPWARSKAVSR